jgi:hypothetical protein
MAKEKPPDLKRIVSAFKTMWTDAKKPWPPPPPSPHNILHRNWTAAWAFDLNGFFATASIKQLTKFLYDSTGKMPRYTDFSSLFNLASNLLALALTIDVQDDEWNHVQNPKLVSQLWGVEITEEAMKSKISKAKNIPSPEALKNAVKADPVEVKAPVKGKVGKPVEVTGKKERPAKKSGLADDPKLQGIAYVASLVLFQIGDALGEDYAEVPGMLALARDCAKLSNALGALGGVPDAE